MEGSNSKANFEGKKTTSFSTESVTPCNMSDPDKNISMINFRKLISHTFPSRILEYFSRHLKEKAFSVCHLDTRSLSKNIDKLNES